MFIASDTTFETGYAGLSALLISLMPSAARLTQVWAKDMVAAEASRSKPSGWEL